MPGIGVILSYLSYLFMGWVFKVNFQVTGTPSNCNKEKQQLTMAQVQMTWCVVMFVVMIDSRTVTVLPYIQLCRSLSMFVLTTSA